MSDDEHRPQRQRKRQSATRFVWYVSLKAAAHDPHGQLAHTADISTGGIGIRSATPIEVGELLFCEVTTAQGNVSAVGRVVHCTRLEDDYYRIGVQFEVVPPNDRPILARLAHE